MENGRIVRFLIIIFALLTLIFYALYFVEEKKTSVLSEEFVEQAVNNLNSRGVEIDESVILRRIPDKDIYVFEGKDAEDYALKIATAFAKGFETEMFTAKLSTPSGFSMALYENSEMEKEIGKFHFSENDFSFVYSAVSTSITPTSSVVNNDDTVLDEAVEKLIEKILLSLNEEKELSYRISGSVENDNFLVVSVVQTFENTDVQGAYINFVFEDGYLVHALGNWIAYKPRVQYSAKMYDGVNVLYKTKLEQLQKIVSQRTLYSFKKGKDSKYFIIPCWEITSVDKKGNVIKEYFDAL